MAIGRVHSTRVSLAFGSTITVTPAADHTEFTTVALTGNVTFDVTVTKSEEGDTMRVTFLSDGSIRTITLGAGQINAAATIVTVVSTKVIVDYVFSGALFNETSRTIAAL